jgi:hypothetical protein
MSVSQAAKEYCGLHQRDRSGFDNHLPFAPPVLRGRELYTLTFHPGARLARQTVGGGVRAIAGTRHPSWVNRASASRLVSDGRTRVGADRALLFVSTGRESRSRFSRPIIAGVVADSFLQSHRNAHATPHLRNPPRRSCRDSQSGR